jgi:hypothetical protein
MRLGGTWAVVLCVCAGSSLGCANILGDFTSGDGGASEGGSNKDATAHKDAAEDTRQADTKPVGDTAQPQKDAANDSPAPSDGPAESATDALHDGPTVVDAPQDSASDGPTVVDAPQDSARDGPTVVDAPQDSASDGPTTVDAPQDSTSDGPTTVDAPKDSASDSAPDAKIDAPVTCTASEIKCNGACVDPETDQANCGYCGHDCQGGACTTKQCQPVMLISASVGGGFGPFTTDGHALIVATGSSGVEQVDGPDASVITLGFPYQPINAISANVSDAGGGNVLWVEDQANGEFLLGYAKIGTAGTGSEVAWSAWTNTVLSGAIFDPRDATDHRFITQMAYSTGVELGEADITSSSGIASVWGSQAGLIGPFLA